MEKKRDIKKIQEKVDKLIEERNLLQEEKRLQETEKYKYLIGKCYIIGENYYRKIIELKAVYDANFNNIEEISKVVIVGLDVYYNEYPHIEICDWETVELKDLSSIITTDEFNAFLNKAFEVLKNK